MTDAGENGRRTVSLIGTSPAEKTTMKSLSIRRTIKIYGKKLYVTAIGNNAFRGYTALKRVNIGNGVESIGKRSFAENPSLKKVVIGKGVKSIGKLAFSGCSKLSSITIKTTKLTEEQVGKKAFTGTPEKVKVYTAKKVVKAYRKLLVKRGLSKKAVVKAR